MSSRSGRDGVEGGKKTQLNRGKKRNSGATGATMRNRYATRLGHSIGENVF